jgi:hypothetical protein
MCPWRLGETPFPTLLQSQPPPTLSSSHLKPETRIARKLWNNRRESKDARKKGCKQKPISGGMVTTQRKKYRTLTDHRRVHRDMLAFDEARYCKDPAQYIDKLNASVIRCSKASMRELTARLFALPRELRDLAYDYIWKTKPSATWSLIKLVLIEQCNDGRIQLPPACSDTLGRLPSCKCLTKAPSFLDPGLMGEQMIPELLEAYHKEVQTWGIADRGSYRLHWNDIAAFAARNLFHLGVTLHGLLKHFRLEISIDCLEASQHRSSRTRLGPGCTNNRLACFVDTLNLLCQEEPRPVTFAFKDKEKKTPSHMEYVFRALSGPFQKLKERGFDPRVTYTSSGFGKWDLSSDGWEPKSLDVWKWTAYDWRTNFTRCNEWFQPACFMGDGFHPNPNGPVDVRDSCDF